MKDKDAHKLIEENRRIINELTNQVETLQRKISEPPTMYTSPRHWLLMAMPKRIQLQEVIRLILAHLNLEVHGIAEGYELKEIVDDDKAKD